VFSRQAVADRRIELKKREELAVAQFGDHPARRQQAASTLALSRGLRGRAGTIAVP
jgi:hypothetical protein